MSLMQATLFDDEANDHKASAPGRIVNVASVPQRSPFRYPGGKTWLIPRIRAWFAAMPTRPALLIEPFAGGGIVGLSVAFELLANHVTFVEMDDDVAAVWETMLGGDAEWLAKTIANFDLTHENVQAILSETPTTTRERAFATILRNRVNHGGIMAPGSGVIKHGENGKGLRSRWYPQTLANRILAIDSIRDRLSFIRGDGIEVMRAHASEPDTAFFIDPPYTAGGKRAGSRLYTHWVIDHEELFRVAGTLAGDFLMTYDDAGELHEMSSRHRFDTHVVAMKNTHHAKMTELLIGRNLAWAR